MLNNSEELVLVRREDHGDRGHVAYVEINRAQRLNALSTSCLDALQNAIDEVSSSDDLRALVLSGAGGKAFIAGADINELVDLNPESAGVFITKIHRVCESLRTCPVPVIAMIQGHCYGAGLEIAAACDMRAATEYSHFGMPEVRVGVPSVVEAALLPGLIGWGRTRELLLTGEAIGAAEALGWGLIDKCLSIDEIDQQISLWTSSILEAAPLAVRAQKALINEWEGLSVQEGIERGIAVFKEAYTSDEPRRYAQSHLDKRAAEKQKG